MEVENKRQRSNKMHRHNRVRLRDGSLQDDFFEKDKVSTLNVLGISGTDEVTSIFAMPASHYQLLDDGTCRDVLISPTNHLFGKPRAMIIR